MSTQLIICLVIFVLTCAGYMTGVWSLATVAMTSISALALTGCLSAKDALAYFSNNNVIMIGAMSVVAAGFNKTQFCTNLANGISKIALVVVGEAVKQSGYARSKLYDPTFATAYRPAKE